VYTGRLVGDVLHAAAKAAAVHDLAEREGLDLARCVAYSDSVNDLPMLSLVGRAVAVNPDSALRAEARVRGWEIRDFRTGRKAARIGVPAALAAGAVAGGIAGAVALRRAQRPAAPPPPPPAGVERWVSATRTGAARAVGTASSGWSRVRGR
jgi:hypothetical protein